MSVINTFQLFCGVLVLFIYLFFYLLFIMEIVHEVHRNEREKVSAQGTRRYNR